MTCDQDHTYTNEQKAYNAGAMDKFVEFTSKDACAAPTYGRPGLTMDYYDGNTVTAMWNYAQHYAMSDHAFSTTFGPSSPGAINLVSAQTHGVKEFNADGTPATTPAAGDYTVRFPDAHGVGTMTGDPDPVYDDCSNNSHTRSYTLAGMTGRNIGDLLNTKKVSWGWFQGGFTPTTAAAGGAPAACMTTHTNVAGVSSTDYNPHHEPFQYYASTANPHHLPPASAAEIGHDGQANHQYDMSSFDQVVGTDNMPAVSFLKAPNYQDGHAGYSDPLDEQHFVVKEINAIQKVEALEGHRHRPRLRRLRRLVRPRRRPGEERLEHHRRRRLLHPGGRLGSADREGLPGPLRPRPAPAPRGHLALREDELRRPPPDRPGLDPAPHRGQLGRRPHR